MPHGPVAGSWFPQPPGSPACASTASPDSPGDVGMPTGNSRCSRIMASALAADQKPRPVTRRTLPGREGPVSLMGVLAVPASATLPATLR